MAAPSAADALARRMASVDDSLGSAWSQLLARWQVRSQEATVEQAMRCQAAVFPGFDCLAGAGSLEQVQRFDRPVILLLDKLQANAGAAALLLGVGQHSVRLGFAGATYDVPRAELDGLWSGRFIAAFRLPPTLPQTLQEGDAGPAAAWVAAQLDRADGSHTATSGPAYFDAALKARVVHLQQGFGLRADGIVGPETLFALASLDPAGPHLARDVP
jgi:general secretion pathway protein A